MKPAVCGMRVAVAGDRLVWISGDLDNPDRRGGLCMRGKAAHQIVGNPARLTTPLIRETRGSDRWREAGWDEALDLIAGHMAQEVGGHVEIAVRAGLLHEIGQVDQSTNSPPLIASAELCSKYGESDEVAQCIRSLQPGAEALSLEALLLNTANKMSDSRPGARKENLAVFIERLRRLESIAAGFEGVNRAFAVKAGKEIRVIVDAKKAGDQNAYELSKEIARAVERELSYPGQIKVSVIRETRAVRYAV